MKILFLFFVLGTLSACQSTSPHYKNTGLNSSFDFPGGPFQEYIVHEQQKIKKARTRAFGQKPSNKTIQKNAPSEIKPASFTPGKTKKYKHAAVILHGLIVTPFKMKEISDFLASQGMLVRNVLLPGHGTVPGDLLKVQKEDWVKAAEYAISETLKDAEHIHLVGYSTGAGIAMTQAFKRDDITSLMLFSPLVEINSSLAPAASMIAKTTSFLPSASYPVKMDEINPYQYYSISFNAVAQAYHVTQELKKTIQQHPKKIPIFMATSLQDSIVRADKNIALFERFADDNSRLMLFSNTPYETKDTRIQVVHSAVPEKNILSLSHEGILSQIDNPVYGIEGSVRDCLLYKSGSDQRKKCESADLKDLYFGEQEAIMTRKDITISRINFNPFFDQMTASLGAFLKSMTQ